MPKGSSRWSGLPLGFLVALALGGCAKSPTEILTHVDADSTVPPLLLLRATIVSNSDADKQASSSFVSLALGDAADRPGPYAFPLDLPLSLSASLAGPVTVTIEGLDSGSGVVVARGTTAAEVVREQQTHASLTLTAVPVGGSDAAGSDGGDNGDGGIVLDDASSDL